MPLWKQFLTLIVLAALGYGGYEGYQRYMAAESTEAKPAAKGGGTAIVELARAERRTLSETIEAIGTTRARQSVNIVPEASGRVIEILFRAGQHVETGAVLVQLDDTIARADLAEAQARLTERKRMLDRVNQLRDSSAVSAASVEEATARFAEAQAQYDRAVRRLSDRSIRAPFGGTVALPEVDHGASVTAGTVITRLDDLTEIEVEFALPETLFARVSPGQTVSATGAAFPGRVFAGQIEAVDSYIDPVSRSFRTRAIIPNSDGVLPAGMFMSLELTLSQTDHIVVPEEAIIFQAAETYVFVAENNVARRVTVKTGQRQDGMVAVLDGLTEGASVIVRGLHRVRNGGAIELLKPIGNGASTAGDQS
ncbi:membrane fusion protein, multidrug efflux system [Thalassovita litoralis]|uniref:Membrane fusion protein, multidrug efflux system n=1 Tax=Thalassovita litoralis TaxID=1010611 RepID=A0A521C531_9RHOB|nr:efflux RND transporter periplasmic adaptor subunit [Thalassovita litoralis]SMO53790.1 membrane fusion protein, multidrug efflux system [Thalassovita litoralis]